MKPEKSVRFQKKKKEIKLFKQEPESTFTYYYYYIQSVLIKGSPTIYRFHKVNKKCFINKELKKNEESCTT